MPARPRFAPLALLVLASALAAGGARAGDALQIEPGKWEMRIEIKSSMASQPQVTTRTECVTDGEWDPDALMTEVEGCTFSDVSSSATRLQWKLTCDAQGGRMTGEADYRSAGDSVDGTMHMTMDAGGMAITLDQRFAGRRVGDC